MSYHKHSLSCITLHFYIFRNSPKLNSLMKKFGKMHIITQSCINSIDDEYWYSEVMLYNCSICNVFINYCGRILQKCYTLFAANIEYNICVILVFRFCFYMYPFFSI